MQISVAPICEQVKKLCTIMFIMIKLNNHFENTKVNVPFKTPYAGKCVFSGVFNSEILFHFSVDYSKCIHTGPGF